MLDTMSRKSSILSYISEATGGILIVLSSPFVYLIAVNVMEISHKDNYIKGTAFCFLAMLLGGILLTYQSYHMEDTVDLKEYEVPDGLESEDEDEADEYCDTCYGSGECQECDGAGVDEEGNDCPECESTGECPDCNGCG